MFAILASRLRSFGIMSIAASLVAALLMLFAPAKAQAHCDSMEGPVVDAARKALAARNVNLILPYVKADAEAELSAAFAHTLEVRALGGEAASLADRYFFETAVRLHRAGEGAPFTGIKDTVEVSPALEAAEEALVSGSLEDVTAIIVGAVEENIATRFHEIEEARATASTSKNVAASRAQVEAELAFEIYINDLYKQVMGGNGHGEVAEAAPAAHQH